MDTLNSLRLERISTTAHTPHWLHRGDGAWPLSNCYVDLWVEILHALNLNPLACLAFTLTTDFEGDQWTFFKVPLHDLFLLYNIDVQELNIWHSLLDQIVMQVRRDRLVLVEVDAFYLPDVSDTNYHLEHEKTTIGVTALDPARHYLRYFHNGGLYTLQDDDFMGIFPAEAQATGATLPPYVEFAKLDHIQQRSEAELATQAMALVRTYMARLPANNPFLAYQDQFQQYMQTLAQHDLTAFHKYAFATMRQYGACYEYTSLFLRWLADYQGEHLRAAAEHFAAISADTQVLLLKTARAVRSKKPFEYLPFLDTMRIHWDEAMKLIAETIS